MIRYTMRCTNGHDFDGWFRSSEGFDTLHAAGNVACTACGATNVEKSLMSPSLSAAADRGKPKAPTALAKGDLTTPKSEVEAALAKLRQDIESTSDYVGLSFADEARAMHDGTKPHRAIHGEAKPAEAKRLIEDGVPIAPLPFIPRQKAN